MESEDVAAVTRALSIAQEAHREYVTRLHMAEMSRWRRLEAIRSAMALGVTAAEIGKALGISRQAVHSMLRAGSPER